MKNKKLYEESLFGAWEVQTENDIEGRAMKSIGIYKGWLDEIAFYLADKCCYSLRFTKYDGDKLNIKEPTGNKVHISFNIDSDTWSMTSEDRATYFENLFNKENRKVLVSKGKYYASVEISMNKDNEKLLKINRALAKLTEEEKELLNLKGK